MFAIIRTGGKQYIVKEGQTLQVEKLAATEKVVFDDVLLIADGDNVKIGMPRLEGAKVEGAVVEHGKGKKLHVIKYKAKVRYRRKIGHRQQFTKVKVGKITTS